MEAEFNQVFLDEWESLDESEIQPEYPLKQFFEIDISLLGQRANYQELQMSKDCEIVIWKKTNWDSRFCRFSFLYTFRSQQLVQTTQFEPQMQFKFLNTTNEIILFHDSQLKQCRLSQSNQWECVQVLGQVPMDIQEIIISDSYVIISNYKVTMAWKNQQNIGWVLMLEVKGRYSSINEANNFLFCSECYQITSYKQYSHNWRQVRKMYNKRIQFATENFFIAVVDSIIDNGCEESFMIYHWNCQQQKIVAKQSIFFSVIQIYYCYDSDLLYLLFWNNIQIFHKNKSNQFSLVKRIRLEQKDIRYFNVRGNREILYLIGQFKIYECKIAPNPTAEIQYTRLK